MEGARTESRNEQDVGWVCMSGQGGIQVGEGLQSRQELWWDGVTSRRPLKAAFSLCSCVLFSR